MSDPGSAGARRRLDGDDRDRRRDGGSRHQGSTPDRNARTAPPATASAGRRPGGAERLQPRVLSRPSGGGHSARHLDDRVALQLPTPTDVVDRRAVLHRGDDHNHGLRRLQLRSSGDMAAAVRRHVDVQRGDHHRFAGRVHCRRVAVAALRHCGRTPAGAPSAQPRHRRRAERARDPRRHRSGQHRTRRRGDRARRGEPTGFVSMAHETRYCR